jgi:hypothetical protein
MKLTATEGRLQYDFDVTTIVDQDQHIYFLIQFSNGNSMLSERLKDGQWQNRTKSNISRELQSAVLSEIETTSADQLFDDLIKIPRLKEVAA